MTHTQTATAAEAIQAAILAGGHHVVHGAAGSGKTSTAVATLSRWLSTATGDGVLLVPTRRRAAVVRDQLAHRLQRTTSSVLVRTPAALAFAILRLRAAALGQPPPTLVSGPEQDQILAELLAGHEEGEGTALSWPASVPPQTRGLRAFRDELRDLHMRAAEVGLDGAGLAEWGRRYDRPEWVAAGGLLQEYTQVMTLGLSTPDRGGRYDSSTIVDEAVQALLTWEEDVPEMPRPHWELVLHDDYQDATLATARLLDALVDDGARVAVFGDADLSVQQFRGGMPALLHTAELPGGSPGAWGAARHVLPQVWRHGPSLREQLVALSAGLPAMQETGRRRATAVQMPSQLHTALLASEAQQVAYIARHLRTKHVHEQVPYSRMAVLVRSSAVAGALRRGLRSAGIPLDMAVPERPLREEPAVRPFLQALEVVLTGELSIEVALGLLTSPIGGMDAVSIRALRRLLRQHERAGSGRRHSDDLILQTLAGAPGEEEPAPPGRAEGLRRVAAVLAAGREAVAEEGATAETVLWAMWSATGLATAWQNQALAGGPGADRADADLDAVMALFRAAEQFTDRATKAGPASFLRHLQSQDFPADTLADQGHLGDSVALHTPAGAAGGEWDVVIVAGVQEDVWPDLRIRDSLLGAAELVDIATGRAVHTSGDDAAERERLRTARREVYEGELRAFVSACSRARRETLVTAVLTTDARPSVFLESLLPEGQEELTTTAVEHPLDLRGLVGRLRAQVRPVLRGEQQDAGDIALASEAAAVLAHLATRDVPGADATAWPVTFAPTSADPLAQPEEPVAVSPSTLEQVTTCPLRWFLTRSGGQPADSAAQSLGNLIHEIAAEHPRGDEEQMLEQLRQRWPELELPEGWVGLEQWRRAERMIGKYAAYAAAHDGPVDTEVDFEVELGRARLKGRVDRVEHTAAGPRIVDLKTGKQPVSPAETERHAQLGSYQVAAQNGVFAQELAQDEGTGSGDGLSAGAALLYLGTTHQGALQREQRPLEEDTEPGWAQEMIAAGVEVMASGAFEARRNDACRTCPVRSSCPAQTEGDRLHR